MKGKRVSLTSQIIFLPDIIDPILHVGVWREEFLAIPRDFEVAP